MASYNQTLETYVEVGQMPVQLGNTKSIPLNRENEVKRYTLKLEATHTNVANATLSVTDLIRLITEIRVTAGGKNNIKMVSAIKMYLNYCKNYGVQPLHSVDTTEGTGKKSWVLIEVPMNMYDMRRPIDTVFPTYRFQNLDLKCTFGSKDSIGTGVTVTDGSVTISEDGVENLTRDFDYAFFKEIYMSQKISSTNPKEEMRLPTEMLYKQFSLMAYVNGVLSDDVIQGVTIKSGSKVIKQISKDEIKAQLVRRNGANLADFTGMLILEAGDRGHGKDFINTRRLEGGFLQLSIELDVVHSGGDVTIDLYSDYVESIPLGV